MANQSNQPDWTQMAMLNNDQFDTKAVARRRQAKKRVVRNFLDIEPKDQDDLISAARDTTHVKGLTHDFYKYPARLSPKFVRATISALTKSGDVVFDPFMGGGTTLVEAMALGRSALGADVSALATFVTSAKTSVLNSKEISELQVWTRRLPSILMLRKKLKQETRWSELGYHRHLQHPDRWRLRKGMELALASLEKLKSEKSRTLARCIVLRTAQWALDGRKSSSNFTQFKSALFANAKQMILDSSAFAATVRSHRRKVKVSVLNKSASAASSAKQFRKLNRPKLILTSPPYPGIHVLYHRWQIEGGKETPAPFWIANKLDGAGAAYYTLGDRHVPELKTYFDNLQNSFESIAKICARNCIIVQVVAFADPSWQLPRYLKAICDADFDEVFLPKLSNTRDGRLWRPVPNRRWYTNRLGATGGSKEVVLFHRRSLRG